MDYVELKLKIKPFSEEILEILSAELSNLGFESFHENNKMLQAYAPAGIYTNQLVLGLIQKPAFKNYSIHISNSVIKGKNWNQLWESNFEPVLIDDLCLIKAPFHKNSLKEGFEIIIEPKMSFGTGHHATTNLMISAILKMDLTGKTILDMGTGTGILAILAEKKGAGRVTAVDNDEWAITNCRENIKLNLSKIIQTYQGETSVVSDQYFDIIFANINKPVILKELNAWKKILNPGGLLLISGILKEDEKDLKAVMPGELSINEKKELKNWLILHLQKSYK